MKRNKKKRHAEGEEAEGEGKIDGNEEGYLEKQGEEEMV
ncbi:hypothetical protein CSUI_011394, partial [Cystoisospora suis]